MSSKHPLGRAPAIVLFTGDQRIFASAVVTHKVHSEAVAETLWGRGKEGQTWEYAYFIDDVRSQNIPNSVTAWQRFPKPQVAGSNPRRIGV